MYTKTAQTRQESRTVVDVDTGEQLVLTSTASTWADRNFHKVFMKNFRKTLKGIKSQQLQVVLWLMENMTPSNEVMLTYNEIADASKTSLQTVVRTIEALEKDNFLCRKERGLMVNPDVVFRGRFASRGVVLDMYREVRAWNRAASGNKDKQAQELEETEAALESAQAQVKRLERKKRELEKQLAPRRKTGPKPKGKKKES